MLPIIISLVVFIVYVFLYIAVKYGIQRSISASYHNLSQAEKWMFTLSTWGYVIGLVLSGLHGTDFQNILLMFAGFLLCTVGVMADDKNPTTKKWHTIGAEGGILLALIWVATWPFWWILIPSVLGIYYMIKFKMKNHTWWVECLAYFTIVLSEFLNRQ